MVLKRFKLKEYVPIDYRKWVLGDPAREGVNIKRLGILTDKELKIWEEAVPYQDQRDDPGQGEIVTYFTLKLLKYFSGIKEVAVPAAIFHDIGWVYENADEWHEAVNSGANVDDEDKRRLHQNRGIILAGRILEKVEYLACYNKEIADIIGDHDTRRMPTTDSGNIVRAADLLWRVTLPHMKIYKSHPDNSKAETALTRMEDIASGLLNPAKCREVEAKIGRVELVNTMVREFLDEGIKAVEANYTPELKRVQEFYK